jgi:hypothetical protein
MNYFIFYKKNIMDKEKYSLFHIEGGLGKHVTATAVAKAIKNNHPDRQLIIVCAYPEIFLNLEFVDRVYRLGMTPYFYQDFIEGKDVLVFRQEPYFNTNHILKKQSLVESWCEVFNLKYDNEKPELKFNLRQIQIGSIKWMREKPIMVIQTNGGPMVEQPYPYSWTRDIPYRIAQELVNYFSQDYHIIQIARNDFNKLNGVEFVTQNMTNTELFSLLLFSTKEILIDSSLQHASAALGKSSTVLWVGTSPQIFGYSQHKNIQATLPKNTKLPDSYMFDYNFNGETHECPLMDDNIFDINEIISSINQQ